MYYTRYLRAGGEVLAPSHPVLCSPRLRRQRWSPALGVRSAPRGGDVPRRSCKPSRRAADSDKARSRTKQGRRARGRQHDWWSPWRTTGAETARRCAAADRRARAPGTTARVRGRRTTRQRPVVHSLQRGSLACARGATAGRARGPILRLRGYAPRGRAHRQAEREHVVTNAILPVPPHPGGATERPAGTTNALTITNGAPRLPRRPRPLNVNCGLATEAGEQRR